MSIFDEQVEGVEGVEEKETKKKAMSQDDLTNIFRDNHKDTEATEPDWTSLLRVAKNERARWEVMNARDTWKANEKEQMFQKMQEEFDKKIDGLLAIPQYMRNKEWYDNLAATDPSASYNPRIQKQRLRDKQALGLGFHLKVSK